MLKGKLGSLTVGRELELPSATGKPSGLLIYKYLKDIKRHAKILILSSSFDNNYPLLASFAHERQYQW